MKIRLIFMALLMITLSCTPSKKVGNDGASSRGQGKSDRIAPTELIQLLRQKPGLQITNRGGSYEILVRGARSINGTNTPLYTLDGVALGREYDAVARTVDVNQIESIRVITPANAAIFGSRGQNGVIAIKTKS